MRGKRRIEIIIVMLWVPAVGGELNETLEEVKESSDLL
jgi:hypothetical protein